MRRGLETLIQDLRYAMRSFRRSPGFVLVALLSLTLGIGATSSIFSVIYGVLVSPYPYARPGEIWAPEVRGTDGRGGHGYSLDEIKQLAALPAFADVMATSGESVLLTGDFPPESFFGVLLTANAMNFLGVPPVIGRTLQPSDVRPDGEAEPVTVISHKMWMRIFEGNPSAIGRSVTINGRPHTVVGVMPPRFGWYGSEGLWLPLSLSRKDIQFGNPIARLAPGVTAAVAEQQLAALNKQFAAERPQTFPAQGFTTRLRNYLDITVASGEMRTSLRLLLGGVAFLLLIACANVANLQLARGSARAREIAVRMSIGAGRRRLIRQLLTESVLLSLAGGALGVLFAFGTIRLIVDLMPTFYVPNESRVTINTPVLLFSLGISIVTGIVFGLMPALHGSKSDVVEALKAGRSTGAETQGRRTRNMLVIAEVALSVVLLVSAGLTMRTFFVLQGIDSGVDAAQVMLVNVPMSQTKYGTSEQRNRFTQEVLDRVRALSGVTAATIGHPLGGPRTAYAIAGQPADDSRRISVQLVGEDYLRAYGVPLLGGRMFDAAEVLRSDRVAVVNQTAARLWPAGTNPIGARVKLTMLERPPNRTLVDMSRGAEVTIVGIVADTKNAGIRAEPFPAIVIPYSIAAPPDRMLAVRSEGDPRLLLNPLRAEIRRMDPDQPLGRPIRLDEAIGEQVIQPRFTMALFTAFAVLGLALAAAGIYSVLSFHVTRRTHELGVRMALGASRGHVLSLMLRMGTQLVLVGLVVGAAASFAATRLLRSQLFGVEPADPLSYIAVVAVLAVVTLAACYVPARRAAAVDPMVALRQE
jgi:putative ABC transport system permease protein